jgi:RND superfamily putative drug exporter
VQIVLRGAFAVASASAFSGSVAEVPGVTAVTAAGAAGNVVALTATLDAKDPFSASARDAVGDIRALTPPAGTELLVGGTTARNVDSLQATADRLPLMVGLLVGATLVLMFLAFGSILLPIKAVVVSALSLAATFGILVWIFQDGHGAGLLDITPAPPEVGIVVLMAAVVFGLSTDYEVFLLSRMVEARTRGATTAEAVTTGLARTGRVISAAALLLIVVTGAFALSTVTTMRFVGIGMIIALVLDATVVRMVLVPAILSLLGNASWWAPGPLRRLQEKAGLSEYAGEELFPTVSVGRHAAPEGAPSRYSTTGATGGAVRPRHASADEPAAVPVAVPAWAASPVPELPTARVGASAEPSVLDSVEAGIDVPGGDHEPVRDTAARETATGPDAEPPAGTAESGVPASPGGDSEVTASAPADSSPADSDTANSGAADGPAVTAPAGVRRPLGVSGTAHDDEDSEPDTTAVLDTGPTVDLSTRLKQEGTQRRG